MISLSKIYDSSPIWFQNVMVTVAGYQKNKNRYGQTYFDHKNFLKSFDALPIEEKLEYQREELVKFVRYAHANSSFYRELYKDVDISKIQSVEALKQLPIVDKEMI